MIVKTLFCLLFASLVTTSVNAMISLPVLATVLSLGPVAVNGVTIPFTSMLFEKSSDSMPLPTFVAASEVTTLVATDLSSPGLSLRSDSAATEQTNATNVGSQHVHSMEEDDDDDIILFFTLLLAIYLWRRCYLPRPDSHHAIDPPDGYPMTQIRSTTSTAPLMPTVPAAVLIAHRSPTY
ncbi:hypothetical protein C0995_000329 [Termitomyces sp. Mi166|nr:hypothetical protein C0995_000329 [Termitomyces sp. Mi166\